MFRQIFIIFTFIFLIYEAYLNGAPVIPRTLVRSKSHKFIYSQIGTPLLRRLIELAYNDPQFEPPSTYYESKRIIEQLKGLEVSESLKRNSAIYWDLMAKALDEAYEEVEKNRKGAPNSRRTYFTYRQYIYLLLLSLPKHVFNTSDQSVWIPNGLRDALQSFARFPRLVFFIGPFHRTKHEIFDNLIGMDIVDKGLSGGSQLDDVAKRKKPRWKGVR